jgi:hypothetical protein
MTQDPTNPFNWRMRTEPSIFAKDVSFTPRKNGKSNSEVQSEVIAQKVANGESPGSINNLGRHTAEKERKMLAYRQFGVYSKATPSIKHPNKHEE